MRYRSRLIWAVAAIVFWTGVFSAWGAGKVSPRSTAELLVDLARDHALQRRGEQTEADVLRISALLRGASRLDERLADAYQWRYELAELGGDHGLAAKMLQKWVELDPLHQGVFDRWLRAGLRTNQTIESREAWLVRCLNAVSRSLQLQAAVYVRLAELGLQRMDLEYAEAQVELARTLDPFHPEAAVLGLAVLPADASADERLKAALAALRVDPLDFELSWQIALLLDEHDLTDNAELFYDHAIELYRRQSQTETLPGLYSYQLSRKALRRGEVEEAIRLAREAMRTDAALIPEVGMYLHWLYEQAGRPNDATALKEAFAERFAAIRDPAEWPVNEVAQAAWFYSTIDPQPQRALRLAEDASGRAVGDPFAARVLGWALAANLRYAEAQRVLRRISGEDAYAAYRLAKLLREEGDAAGAERVIGALEEVPAAGPARALVDELGVGVPATQPSRGVRTRLLEAVAGFDPEVFLFHEHPERFLKAEISFEDRAPAVGEPWVGVFTLTNRGEVPISLGPDWMTNPVMLLSFEMEGDKDRSYPQLMTVAVDRVRVLRPGQTVKVRQTLDVGPLRQAARQTPQQLQRVSVRGILDPVRGRDGGWRPGVAGQEVGPAYMNRLPMPTSREVLHAVFSALGSESKLARFRAVEVIAELLGERQRAEFGRLNYRPQPVPADRLYQSLMGGLGDESWEMRVRTLAALDVIGLDAAMLGGVESCLEHPHWLVRMMALGVVARRGTEAREVVGRLASDDPDALVRDYAKSLLMGWSEKKKAEARVESPVAVPGIGGASMPTSSAPSVGGAGSGREESPKADERRIRELEEALRGLDPEALDEPGESSGGR